MKAKLELTDHSLLPPTSEALVLDLVHSAGRRRLRLLKAGSQRFGGALFNALLNHARARISDADSAGANASLGMAVYLARNANNRNAEAKCFFAIGTVWHDSGQPGQAIGAYRKAARLFGQTGASGGEARVLARLGQALATVGKIQPAIRAYRHALRRAQSMKDTRLAAQIANNLGNTFRKANDHHRAYLYFQRAIKGAQVVSDRELGCTAQGNLGLTEFELGQYARAESTLREAVACATSIGNTHLEASHTGDLGNVCRATGRLMEAEQHYRHALALARELADPRFEEIGLGDLGILLFQMGRANEAILLLEQACTLSQSIGEMADAAQDAYHLSRVYRDLGDLAAEDTVLHDCLQLAETGQEWSVKVGVLHALAYNSMMRGDYPHSERLLVEADKTASLILDRYNSWSSPYAWGLLGYHQNNYLEAEHDWDDAFSRANENDNIFGILSAMINRGSALIMLHRLTEAETLMHDALNRAQVMSLPDDERIIWEALGLAREQRQDDEGARSCYEHAMNLIESGRSALSLEEHRMGFLAIREGPYVRLIRLLLSAHHSSSAWEMCERVRSRNLVDTLAYAEIHSPPSLPDLLVQVERELLPVFRLRNFEVQQSDTRHAQFALQEINRLRAKLQSVWEEMAPLAPEYVDQRRGEILHWPDVKEILR